MYTTPTNEDIKPSPFDWTILIDGTDKPDSSDVSIYVRLNSAGRMFQGTGDQVSLKGELDIRVKALQADYLFNIPDEMKLAPWLVDLSDPSGETLSRSFIDKDGNLLVQSINSGSSVILRVQSIN